MKFNQCETSRTLKIDLFEIPHNESIGQLFWLYKLLFRIKLILGSSYNSSWLKPLYNIILIMFFIGFLFRPTSLSHTPPKVLDIPNHMPSKINQIYYQWYIQIIILYGSNTLPIKKLSHEEPLSFKVWQHVQQQLYLHYKVHWILCKMVGAPSFSEPYSCKQPPLHSPPKIRSSTSVNFHLPIHLCLFTNSSLQSPLTLPSSIPHQFLTFLVLHTNIPTIKTKNVFPTSAI